MSKNKLDAEVLNYIINNKDGITELNNTLDKYHKNNEEKIKQLKGLLDEIPKSEKLYTNIKIWNQDWIKRKLEMLLRINLDSKKFNGATINIKVRISPELWSIEFWDLQSLSSDAEKILKEHGNNFQYSKDEGSKHITYQAFKRNERPKPEFIHEKLMEVLHKIKS